ncbi:3331_t:CDS:2, partial [Paraglomus occultum]
EELTRRNINWVTELAGSGHSQFFLTNRGDVTFHINRHRVPPGSPVTVYVLEYTYYFRLPGAHHHHLHHSPSSPTPPSPPPSCIIHQLVK